MKRIALIGPADREELQRLSLRLDERSAKAVILDSRSEPEFQFSSDGSGSVCGIDLANLDGVYVSDLGLRSPRPGSGDSIEEPIEDSSIAAHSLAHSQRHLIAWTSLLEILSERLPVINRPSTWDLHALKPWECFQYEQREFPLPETAASTSCDELTAWAVSQTASRIKSGNAAPAWIRKGMVGGYSYTQPFELPNASSGTPSANSTAVLPRTRFVQRRVEGDNYRAYVADGRVLGAALIASLSGSSVDSRQGDIRIERVELPGKVCELASAAAEHWKLRFAAVDFMRDEASREYLLLECNSAPFFVNFERQTGIDVSSRLADLLLKRRF